MYAIDSSGNLLSPLNIQDPLLRAEFFREIRLAQTDSKYRDSEWQAYTIQPADILSPELIAWKVLQVDTVKWLVLIACSLDDSRERMNAGDVIYIPSTYWIRERIRYYCELEGSA